MRAFNTSIKMSTLAVALITLTNCGKSSTNSSVSDDLNGASSASSAVAGAIGGALSNSNSNGTVAMQEIKSEPKKYASLLELINPIPKAFASGFCPTWHSTDANCSVRGSSMWLNYSSCTYLGYFYYTGVQEISMSSGSAACGQFPNPGANGTLYRQFVASPGSNVAGNFTVSGDLGSALVDHSSANLSNFDNQNIATIHNGGYGLAVSFNAQGARSSINFAHRTVVTNWFDHSVVGNLNLSEASASATSRTINSGTVTVYHNLLKIVGTSTISNLVHKNTCCLPVQGSITTAFTAGQNVSPTTLGSKYVGKSETLTFNGCGSATYQDINGNTASITLSRCL